MDPSNDTKNLNKIVGSDSEKLGFEIFRPMPTFRVRPLAASPGAPWRKVSRVVCRPFRTFLNAVGILAKTTSGIELQRFEIFVLDRLWGPLPKNPVVRF